MVLTYLSLFWVVCHPSKTFPPKEFERELQNRLSLLPIARPYPFLSLTHDPPSGAWALCVLHFCVCLKLVCYSCVCHGLEVRLRILPLILDLLWCELFWSSILYGLLPPRAGPFLIVGFLPFSPLFAPFVGLPVFLPCHFVIPVAALFDPCLLGLFRPYCILFSQLVTMTQYGHWVYTHATLGFLDPLHYLWAPLAHFFLLRHPWPICFPWAFSVHFLILHSHELLITLLGFPSPITTSFILEVYGLSTNPLLS